MKKIINGFNLGLISILTAAQAVFAEETTTETTEAVEKPGFTFNSGGFFANLGDLLRNVLIILFFFAALLAFVFIVIGGIQWITAGGDKIAAGNARDRITAAIIGLVVVVAAFAITAIITTALGINIFTGSAVPFPCVEGGLFGGCE